MSVSGLYDAGLIGQHHCLYAVPRTQLGEKEFEQARAEGRAMSMEEAIEYALNGSISSQA